MKCNKENIQERNKNAITWLPKKQMFLFSNINYIHIMMLMEKEKKL